MAQWLLLHDTVEQWCRQGPHHTLHPAGFTFFIEMCTALAYCLWCHTHP